jgi:uncharacterized protein
MNTVSTITAPVSMTADSWRVLRPLTTAVAGLCLLLAIAGVLIPGLPSTPFVLLASYLLQSANPSLQRRLEKCPWIGAVLVDWRRHGAISKRAKWLALSMVTIAATWLLANDSLSSVFRAVACIAVGAGGVVILRLPVRVPDCQQG